MNIGNFSAKVILTQIVARWQKFTEVSVKLSCHGCVEQNFLITISRRTIAAISITLSWAYTKLDDYGGLKLVSIHRISVIFW